MAITEADINDMLAFLITHPEHLDRFRALSISPELQTVPLRMDRLEVAMARLESTVDVLAQSTQRLAEESANARKDIGRLDSTVEQLVVSTAKLTEESVTTRRDINRMDASIEQLVASTARLTEGNVTTRQDVNRMDASIEQLVASTAKLTEESVSSRQDINRMDATMEQLVRSTAELAAESVRTGRILNRLDGTVSNMKGKTLETRYSSNVENWFGDYVLAPVKVAVRRLPGLKDAEASGLLSPQDVVALRALDLVVRGQDEETGGEVYLAAEISNVIDVDDVARARQRADLMRRLQIDARAFVGGHEITSDAVTYATTAGVMVDLHPEG